MQVGWTPHHLQIYLLHQLAEHVRAKITLLDFFLEEWFEFEQLLDVPVLRVRSACCKCRPFVAHENVNWRCKLLQLCNFKLANMVHGLQILVVVYVWPLFVVTLLRIIIFLDAWNSAYSYCLIAFAHFNDRTSSHKVDIFSCKSTVIQFSEVVWSLMVSTNENSEKRSSFFLFVIFAEITKSFEFLWTF